jgi:hypothetical protein
MLHSLWQDNKPQFHLILIDNGTGDCKAWRFIGADFALTITGVAVLADGGYRRE